jgi:hypothetical protein
LRDGAGRPGRLAAASLALAAVSLLLPWALAFDPWSWLVWGREVTRLELDTAGGPSWKPLPVVATTILTLAGGAAPALWLVLARAGGLLAIAGAAALAGRLAGAVAAVAAAAAMALSDWWLLNTALGNSEGLLAAAAVWAVVAQLAGRHRIALALLLAAALLRPEAWPFLGGYALWLWRTGREPLGLLAVTLLPVPLLWFGPDVLGAGGALGASSAARGTASPQSAVYADFPALEVLADFAELLTIPALLAAAAGAALGGTIARRLAAAGLAWVALVAVMTQAGYAGNPRYNVAAAAVGCVLAGVGVAALARRVASGGDATRREEGAVSGGDTTARRDDRAVSGGDTTARRDDRAVSGGDTTARRDDRVDPDAARAARRPSAALGWPFAAALAAGVLAFTAGDLSDQVEELGDRADRRTDLDALVDRVGGASAISACAPARTNQPMKAMVAWRLDVSMEHLADRPRAPAAVLRAPPGYEGEPAEPRVPAGFEPLAREGDWELVTAC